MSAVDKSTIAVFTFFTR